MATKKELLVELDGPGVKPENVDTLRLLRLAEASFDLTVRVAEAGQLGLSLRGLRILDKCVAIAAMPNDMKLARLAAARALQIVSGSEQPPKGAEVAVRDLRLQLRQLPETHTAKVIAGRWTRRLRPPETPKSDRPWERTQLRVRPVRVGSGSGSSQPRAWLASPSEPQPFIVEVSEADARKLGAALYREIDVTLDLCRDIDAHIETGKIIEVEELSDDEPVSAWRSWFATNAPEWNEVDNVLEGLGRGSD